jgi:hypothetical protein
MQEVGTMEIFSPEWMQAFGEQWNAEPAVADALAAIYFNSTIGYGFENEAHPRGAIVVKNGRVVAAGKYEGQKLSWDLRADREHWEKWRSNGLNMMGLSMAYLTKKLKFPVGNYTAMIKDPRMAGPFVRSFEVMTRI